MIYAAQLRQPSNAPHVSVRILVECASGVWNQGPPPSERLAKMAYETIQTLPEAADFRSLLNTITDLAQVAEDRGDRTSAAVLVNVAALLAEVQATRPQSNAAPIAPAALALALIA